MQLPLEGKSHQFVTSRITRMEWDSGCNIIIWTTKLFATAGQMTFFFFNNQMSMDFWC